MNRFRILYRWQGREYATTLAGRDAHSAKLLADVTIMPGATVFAVEVTQ